MNLPMNFHPVSILLSLLRNVVCVLLMRHSQLLILCKLLRDRTLFHKPVFIYCAYYTVIICFSITLLPQL